MYTFWDYKRKRWERDDGLRLDHILVSSALMARLQDPASIATSADWRAPAIMRPYG
jgi:exonuclease III